jgi:hypothetical protein
MNVRFGSLADMRTANADVRFTPNSDRENGLSKKVMSALPRKRTSAVQLRMSALGQKQTLRAEVRSGPQRARSADIQAFRLYRTTATNARLAGLASRSRAAARRRLWQQ